MRKAIATMLLATLVLLSTGCPIDPPKARDAVVSAYGFISDLQQKHLQECTATPTAPPCVAINKGVAVQRLAAATLNEYCAGPPLAGDATYADGGPCSAQAGVQPRLKAALQDLDSVVKDLKKLGGS